MFFCSLAEEGPVGLSSVFYDQYFLLSVFYMFHLIIITCMISPVQARMSCQVQLVISSKAAIFALLLCLRSLHSVHGVKGVIESNFTMSSSFKHSCLVYLQSSNNIPSNVDCQWRHISLQTNNKMSASNKGKSGLYKLSMSVPVHYLSSGGGHQELPVHRPRSDHPASKRP